jgi:hypothetical protein
MVSIDPIDFSIPKNHLEPLHSRTFTRGTFRHKVSFGPLVLMNVLGKPMIVINVSNIKLDIVGKKEGGFE